MYFNWKVLSIKSCLTASNYNIYLIHLNTSNIPLKCLSSEHSDLNPPIWYFLLRIGCTRLLCRNWFACKQLISAKIALGLKLISLRLKRISADKYSAWILMMRHAGERQKNLHNHPFTWNKKQTIHFQACEERREVCQQLSRLFSPSGALISFKPHVLAQVLCRMPVGSAGVRMPSVVTPSHPPWRLSTLDPAYLSAPGRES